MDSTPHALHNTDLLGFNATLIAAEDISAYWSNNPQRLSTVTQWFLILLTDTDHCNPLISLEGIIKYF